MVPEHRPHTSHLIKISFNPIIPILGTYINTKTLRLNKTMLGLNKINQNINKFKS